MKHVIHLDDQKVILSYMKGVCARIGLSYDGFQSWDQFIEPFGKAVRAGKQVLFISDLEMPVVNGEVVVNTVLRHYPSVPVLLFSSIDRLKGVELARQLSDVRRSAKHYKPGMPVVTFVHKSDRETDLPSYLRRFQNEPQPSP